MIRHRATSPGLAAIATALTLAACGQSGTAPAAPPLDSTTLPSPSPSVMPSPLPSVVVPTVAPTPPAPAQVSCGTSVGMVPIGFGQTGAYSAPSTAPGLNVSPFSQLPMTGGTHEITQPIDPFVAAKPSPSVLPSPTPSPVTPACGAAPTTPSIAPSATGVSVDAGLVGTWTVYEDDGGPANNLGVLIILSSGAYQWTPPASASASSPSNIAGVPAAGASPGAAQQPASGTLSPYTPVAAKQGINYYAINNGTTSYYVTSDGPNIALFNPNTNLMVAVGTAPQAASATSSATARGTSFNPLSPSGPAGGATSPFGLPTAVPATTTPTGGTSAGGTPASGTPASGTPAGL